MAKKVLPSTYVFVAAAAVGLALGALLSFMFGRVALTVKPFDVTVFGYSTGEIISGALILGIVLAIVFLAYVSFVVRDTAFPTSHPVAFVIETLIVAFVPASTIYVITDFRDNGKLDLSSLNKEFLLLATKFGIFHLLFQFSGAYTYMIGTK